MTDHLDDARKSSRRARGQLDPMTAIAHLAYALDRLADAIEELRPTINPELAVQPETVPTLLAEHRDRTWRDRGGYIWHAAVDHEDRMWWCEKPGTHDDELGVPRAAFGPFTAVSDGAL